MGLKKSAGCPWFFITFLLLFSTAFPWFTITVVVDNDPHFGCDQTYFYHWFTTSCTNTFFCKSSCNASASGRGSATNAIFIASFVFMLIALILSAFTWIKILKTKKSRDGYRNSLIFGIIVMLFTLIAIIVLGAALPGALNNDGCSVPDRSACESFTGDHNSGAGIWIAVASLGVGALNLFISFKKWRKPEKHKSSGSTVVQVIPTPAIQVVSPFPVAYASPSPVAYAPPAPVYGAPPPVYGSPAPVYTQPSPMVSQPVGDERIRGYLAELNMSEYFANFANAKFDWATFSQFDQLSEHQQAQLIPDLGPRHKLVLMLRPSQPPPPSHESGTPTQPIEPPPYSETHAASAPPM